MEDLAGDDRDGLAPRRPDGPLARRLHLQRALGHGLASYRSNPLAPNALGSGRTVKSRRSTAVIAVRSLIHVILISRLDTNEISI
jgi:hypothetical protein